MTSLHVHTLGTINIQRGGQTLDGFVSQKTVTLFIYLLCHPREHPRETLAEHFWAETTTVQALKNLRTVLSNLQKKVGDYLNVTRQTIAIEHINDIWFDVSALETHHQTVQTLQSRPSSPRKLQAELESMLALYQGDFLSGLKVDNSPELETWLELERERLRAYMVDARFQLIQVALKRGTYALGVEHGRHLVTLEPYWEDAYRLLMTLYANMSNRTAALQVYENLSDLLADELGAEPEPETTTLYEQIKTRRYRPKVSPALSTNLMTVTTGRYVAVPSLVAQVEQKLDDPDCRLVTLLGIGGIGKTNLAQVIARSRLQDYQDGVFFVPLESLTDAEFVAQAIVNVTGISQPDETRPALLTLADYFKDRHCLIVLDNFEHILPAAADVAHLLTACPYIQILVTSREQLNLTNEHIVQMVGLSYDDDESPAAQLFALNAQQINPAFVLKDHSAAVARIYQLVDGLPLAIVLAASWTQFLTPQDIADRIEANIDFLTSNRRDIPERHKGINALLHSAWDALSAVERAVMLRLAVFPGHFDADAAQAIAGANIQALSGLVSKSLVEVDVDGRYHLHELLRRFTYQQIADSGQIKDVRRAHHQYYSAWIDKLHAEQLPTHTQLTAIDREYHNLWYFDWLPVDEQYQYILKLAKILPDYWFARGIHLQEGIALLRQVLPQAQGWLKANVYVRLGRLFSLTGDYNEARPLLEEGLSLSQQHDDVILATLALAELNRVVFGLGDVDLAIDYLLRIIALYDADTAMQDIVGLREVVSRANSNLAVTYLQLADLEQAEYYGIIALQQQRDSDNQLGEAVCLNTLGIIALDRQQFQLAHDYFKSALDIAYAIDHKRHQTIFSGNLAEALHHIGALDDAFQMYAETLRKAHHIDNRKTILNVLEQLASIALDSDHAEDAARLMGMALNLRESLDLAIAPRQEKEFADRQARLSAMLGADRLKALIQIGRTTTISALLSEFFEDAKSQ